MKILMVGPDREVHGGISGVVNGYYKSGLGERAELKYIGTMAEGSKWYKLLKALSAYARFICCVRRYDVIHVNMASDSSYYRKMPFIYLTKFVHKKLIIHQHGGDFENFYEKKNLLSKKMIRHCLNKADAFLVFTPLFKKFFSGLIDDNKIRIVPNTIKLPQRFEKEYDNHNIIYLGRICKEKGIYELVQAVEELQLKYSDIHLFLGGIWEDDFIKAEIRGKEDFITFLGWLDDERKQAYLKKCSIMVLPSYFEGQPVAVLEGMSAYCTCVASSVGGIPYMIDDGKNGVLIEAKDKDSLKVGLDKALSSKTFRKMIGENAYKKIEAEFEIEAGIEKLMSVYYEVMR